MSDNKGFEVVEGSATIYDLWREDQDAEDNMAVKGSTGEDEGDTPES